MLRFCQFVGLLVFYGQAWIIMDGPLEVDQWIVPGNPAFELWRPVVGGFFKETLQQSFTPLTHSRDGRKRGKLQAFASGSDDAAKVVPGGGTATATCLDESEGARSLFGTRRNDPVSQFLSGISSWLSSRRHGHQLSCKSIALAAFPKRK